MSHYRHLSIEEREKLYLMAEQGETLRQIARELNRAVSTISRELKRNKAAKYPYSPSRAQRNYEKRRKLCGRKHILSCPEKREYIRHLIQNLHWSPEEIANRLKLESAALQLSYGSIYRAINAGLFDANKREASRSRKKAFAYHLRRKGKKKRKNGDKSKQGQHYRTAKRIWDRPAEANNRSELGHFEADTVVYKQGGECLLSLVDRKSRFTLAAKLPNSTSEAARDAIVFLLSRLPPDKVKSSRRIAARSLRCMRMLPQHSEGFRSISQIHILPGNAVRTKTPMASFGSFCRKDLTSALFRMPRLMSLLLCLICVPANVLTGVLPSKSSFLLCCT